MEDKVKRPSAPVRALRKIFQMQEITVIIPFLIVVTVASLLNPVFYHPLNLASIAKMMSIWGFLAIGETFIIITGEIDISVGSMSAFGAMFFAFCMANLKMHWAVALLCLTVATVALSLFNGYCIVKLKMPAFIVTIAMLYMCKGFARTLTFAKPINVAKAPFSATFLRFGQATFLGLSWSFWFLLVFMTVAYVLLKKTAFGSRVIAVGDSAMAARISGVDADRIKLITFAISGLMVALVSMFLVGRETVANPNNGDGWEMQVVAACAIGGISLNGGSGSMLGTFFGVAFMAVISNALNMLAVNNNWQTIVVGAVIVLAVLFDIFRRRRKFGVSL